MDANGLKLKIDSAQARADLDALAKSIDRVSQSASKSQGSLASFASSAEQSLGRATRAMEKYAQVAVLISKIKIGGSGSQIRELGQALDFVGKARGISENKVAGIRSLSTALGNIKTPTNLAGTLRTLETLSKFRGPSATSIKRLEEMFVVLNSAKEIPNAQKIARDLDMVAASAARAANALSRLPAGLRNVGAASSAAANGFATGANAANQHTKALGGVASGAGRARGSLVQLSNGLDGLNGRFRLSYQLGTLFATMFAAFTLGGFVRGVYEANVALLKLQKAVLFSTGTFQGASQATEEYLAISQKLGLSVKDTVETYGRFVIAAKASGLSIQQTNKIYEALGTAMAVVGSSAQQQQLAFYGLTEMMQKGVVYSKEFNRQIGAQLPGNAVIGARALSELTGKQVSVAQFFQAMHSGMIQSAQFIPVWAQQVQKMYQSLLPLAQARPDIAVTRLQNAFVMFSREIGKGDFMAAIGMAFNRLTAQIITTGKDGLPHLTDGMKNLADELGRGLASAINGIATALQFVVGHIHEIIKGLEAFAAFEIASKFSEWGTAAAGAAQNIMRVAEAQLATMRAASAAARAQGSQNAVQAATAGGGFSARAYRAANAANAANSGIGGFARRAAPLLDAGVSTAFAALTPLAIAAAVALTAFSDQISGVTTAAGYAVTYGDLVQGFFKTLTDSITGFLDTLGVSMAAFGPNSKKLGNSVATVLAFITSTLSAFFLPFKEVGVMIGTGISNLITMLVGLGKTIYDVFHGNLTAAYNDAKNAGKQLFNNTVGGYQQLGTNAKDSLFGAGSFNATYQSILAGASSTADERSKSGRDEAAGNKQIEAAVQLQNASAALQAASQKLESAIPGKNEIPTPDQILKMVDNLAAGAFRSGTPTVLPNGIATPGAGTAQDKVLSAILSGAPNAKIPGSEEAITPDLLRSIAYFESHFNPNAKNATTGASGIFQIEDNTYNGLVRNNPSLKGTDRTDPNDAVKLYMELLREDIPKVAASVGHDLSNPEIYATAMLGRPAASKFLGAYETNPTALASDVVGQSVVRNNPSVFYQTGPNGKPTNTPLTVTGSMEQIANSIGGTSSQMAQLTEGGKALSPQEIMARQDTIRRTIDQMEAAADPGAAAVSKYNDTLSKLGEMLAKDEQIVASGHGQSVVQAEDHMRIVKVLQTELQTMQDALNPFTKLNRLSQESADVEMLRARGLTDLADFQTELNKVTEEHIKLTAEQIDQSKQQFLADEERKKQLEALAELNKAVLEGSVAGLRASNSPNQNQVLDQVLKLPGQNYQEKLAYASQGGAGGAPSLLSQYQATASANSASTEISGVSKITNDLTDQAADLYGDKATQKYRQAYRDYLRELTGDTTDSVSEIEAKYGQATAQFAASAAKMKTELENPPGFQKWVDSVKPLGEALEEVKAKFAEDLSQGITDALLGKKDSWKKMFDDIREQTTKAQVDNLLSGVLKGTGLASGAPKTPEAAALVGAGDNLKTAAQLQIQAAQALAGAAQASHSAASTVASGGQALAAAASGTASTPAGAAGVTSAATQAANAATTAATAATNTATAATNGISATQQITSGSVPGITQPGSSAPSFIQKLFGMPSASTGMVGAPASGGAGGFIDNISSSLMGAAQASPGAGMLNFVSNGLLGAGNLIPQKPGTAPSAAGSLLGGVKSLFSGIGNLFGSSDDTPQVDATAAQSAISQGLAAAGMGSPASSGGVSATGATSKDFMSSIFGKSSPLGFLGDFANGDIGSGITGALGIASPFLNGLFKDPTKRNYAEPNGIIGTMSNNKLNYQTKAAAPNLWAGLVNMAFQGGMGSENNGTQTNGMLGALNPFGSSAFGGQGGGPLSALMGGGQGGSGGGGGLSSMFSNFSGLFGGNSASTAGVTPFDLSGMSGSFDPSLLSSALPDVTSDAASGAADAATDAASSGFFSGIGDFISGLFSEGGISTQPLEVVKLRSGHRDYNIRHYAEGTHNTNGGLPAILHPNEAVIPLSKNRAVPVEMKGGKNSGMQFHSNITIVAPNPDGFRKSSGAIDSANSKMLKRAALRNLTGTN